MFLPNLNRTKWLFISLSCYLLSQGFTIPVLAIGPSWAMWPTLSDFTFCLFLLSFLLNFRYTSVATKANTAIFCTLIIIFFGCVMSFLWHFTWLGARETKASTVGVYQLYRLVQFLCIFWMTAKIPLTQARIRILKSITTATLLFVCLGIILTYLSIVPLSALTAHLPQDLDTAGPWAVYKLATLERKGWGTIGYNHAYVAAQVLMLLGLKIHLSDKQNDLNDNLFIFLSILSCFLSGSRSGLLAIMLFASRFWLKKPIYAFIATVVSVFAICTTLTIAPYIGTYTSNEASILERQSTVLAANDAENLSGRDLIWAERISFLNDEPVRWFLGSGFGAAMNSGENGHMLPLHIIIELGLIGLLIFTLLFYQILYYVHKSESKDINSMFWLTISLLFSSISQETFYPTPALGHFTGLYLCAVAIALRSKPINAQLER